MTLQSILPFAYSVILTGSWDQDVATSPSGQHPAHYRRRKEPLLSSPPPHPLEKQGVAGFSLPEQSGYPRSQRVYTPLPLQVVPAHFIFY